MNPITKPECLGLRELSATIADAHGISKANAKAILETLRDAIIQNLLENKRVSLYGLGYFELRDTKGRLGRNPKTGEAIPVPPGRKVKFQASHGLKSSL